MTDYACKNCHAPAEVTNNWKPDKRLTLPHYRVVCSGDCPPRNESHVDPPIANGLSLA